MHDTDTDPDAPIDPEAFAPALQAYRDEIDALDQQLTQVLARRIAVVQAVGQLKTRHAVTGSVIRPGREAAMVRALLASPEAEATGRATMVAIWRLLIGRATATESPLHTLTLAGDIQGGRVSDDYFGPEVPRSSLPWPALLEQARREVHAIAVLPFACYAPWWEAVTPPLYVFACLPFLAEAPSHLAVGHVQPELTGDDTTLYYDAHQGVLHSIAGFYHDQGSIAALRALGAYANPLAP